MKMKRVLTLLLCSTVLLIQSKAQVSDTIDLPDSIINIGYTRYTEKTLLSNATVLKNDRLLNLPSSHIDQSLQGLVPGLLVLSQSGSPASSSNILLNSGNAIANSSPLIVIDGVFVAPLAGQNPLAYLNPGDIESVTILNELDASAIYGLQGVDGAIVVKTKNRSYKEKRVVGVHFSLQSGNSSFREKMKVMNADQYSEYMRMIHVDNPWQTAFVSESTRKANGNINTDWPGLLIRPSQIFQNYDFGLNGNMKRARYYTSINYYKEPGTMILDDFERWNVRTNSEFDVAPGLKVGESFGLCKMDRRSSPNMFSTAYTASPLMPVYNDKNIGGFMGPEPQYVGINDITNPLAVTTFNVTNHKSTQYNGLVYGEYAIPWVKGLVLHADIASNNNSYNSNSMIPRYDLPSLGNRSHLNSELNQAVSTFTTLNANANIRYGNIESVSAIHHFQFLGGFSELKRSDELNSTWASYITQKNDVNTNRTIKNIIMNGYYDFKSKYIFAFNLNYGNSIFDYKNTNETLDSPNFTTLRHSDNSKFFTYSLKAGWNIYEEFFKTNPVVTNLKLRAAIGGANYNNYLNLVYENIYDNRSIYSGLDFELFHKLNFNIDYYNRNMDVNMGYPLMWAFPVQWVNSGMQYRISYEQKYNDFIFSVSSFMTTIKSSVGKLKNDITYGNPYNSINKEGYAVKSFYGYVCEGIFQSQEEIDKHAEQPSARPGDLKFKDLNGDRKIDESDRSIIGKPFPDFIYGLTFSGGWKNIDFSMLWYGSYGMDVYNNTRSLLLGPLNYNDGNRLVEALDAWTPENHSQTVPRADLFDQNNNRRFSTFWLEKASYLRLKNIQAGYTIKYKECRLRIYVGASNLVTITKYKGLDPEVGNSNPYFIGIDDGFYPMPRTMYAGIQFNY